MGFSITVLLSSDENRKLSYIISLKLVENDAYEAFVCGEADSS